MIAPLAKLIDWWAIQVLPMPWPRDDERNPRLEEALQFLKGPDFIPAESQPARVVFNPDESENRRFAPRGAGAWAALARSGLLPAGKKWRSRRASCCLTLTSFTTRWALPRRMRRRRSARRWTSPQPQSVRP